MKLLNTMNKRTLIFILSCSISLYAVAQSKTYNEEVTVVASYEPTLSDAFKQNKNPKITDTVITKASVLYSFRTKPYTNIFVKPEPIKPAKMQSENLTKLYRHYLRLGMGNYTTPYIEYFYNTTRSKSSSLAVHVKHLSSNGKVKDYHYSDNSSELLNIGYKKFTSKHTWRTGLDAGYDLLHWYGFKPSDYNDTILSKDRFKQSFLNIGGYASLSSNFNDSTKMHHTIGLQINHFADKYKTAETSFNANALLVKSNNWLDMPKQQLLSIDMEADIDSYTDSLGDATPGIITIAPTYKLYLDMLELTGGVSVNAQIDTTSELHVFPLLNVSLPLADHMYEIYAGTRGNLQKNSFRVSALENPFIASVVPLGFTKTKAEYYFGFKGNVSSRFSFNTMFNYKSIRNLAMFVNIHDTLQFANNSNRFTMVYDDADLLRLSAECYYKVNEKFKLMARGNYYNYTLAKEEKPWHLQPYDVTLGIDYNMQNKIIMRADFTYIGERFARILDPTTNTFTAAKLDGIIDPNLTLEYRYSKIWSAFISANNLSGSRYMQWNNYPGYGFQIMGGLTISVK